MSKYIGMKGFDHMGFGMPKLLTPKAKKKVQSFEARVIRMAQDAERRAKGQRG